MDYWISCTFSYIYLEIIKEIIMNIENRLIEMKNQCDSLLTEKAQEEGQLKAWNKQLKDSHGIFSVKQGKKMLEKLDSEIMKMEKEEINRIEEIEEKYDWD